MRKSTEYWETELDPCCKERSQLLASLPCKEWSKIFFISAVNKGSVLHGGELLSDKASAQADALSDSKIMIKAILDLSVE